MLEFIRTHRRLMQFVLLLFILPSFAFFGLEGYMGFRDRSDAIAKVGRQTITQQDMDAAQRIQMERFRQMLGERFDPKMLDTPESRQNLLEGLIAERAMAAEATEDRLFVSDQTLQQTILEIPGMIGPDGKFDMERYKSMLVVQRMTPAMFDARLRHDLTLNQVSSAVHATSFVPKTVADRLSDLNEQQREVQSMLFKASDFISKVNVTDEMLQAYYDKNSNQFEIPEQVKAEYVILSRDMVMDQISVSDAEIKAYYDTNIKRFTEKEQRRASHILVGVDASASDADKAVARKEAEDLLAQVRKNPGNFGALAKAHSDDPGSAERGGDLGFFGEGMMVKPFEDAVYKLKQGEISDLVESDFGFHIIRLTEIKPKSVQSFDEVKRDIVDEIKQRQAAQKFTEMASQLNDIVYEQSESLKPAAEQLNLKIEVVDGLTRTPNPSLPPSAPFNQPKFLNALFADDPIKNKRNTDAVEVSPGVLIAGRVVDHKPVTRKPFEEVRDQVRAQVVRQEAADLARKAGEALLAAAKAGEKVSGFGPAKLVSRLDPQDVNVAAVMAIMKADAGNLPAYVGLELPGQGYGVYRINKVTQPAKQDVQRRENERQQIANVLAQQELYVYIEALKDKAEVEILRPQLKSASENRTDQ